MTDANTTREEREAHRIMTLPLGTTIEQAEKAISSALRKAREKAYADGYDKGCRQQLIVSQDYLDKERNRVWNAAMKEAIEWCMAFRRDDGTAQKIEEKLRSLKPGSGE